MKNEELVTLINKDELINEVKQLINIQKQEILYELKNRKNEHLYTRKELAEYLRVSTQTIINWSSRGIINPVYIQGRSYYKAAEIEEVLNNDRFYEKYK